MKLYDGGKAPNPRRVRIFLAEKGVEVELVPVDMGALGHKSDEITRLNPLQRLPVLILDDGRVLCETVAICRYIEALHPDKPLMGVDDFDRSHVEMWQRRMESHFLQIVANAFRHTHPAMKTWEVPQFPEFGESNKPKVIKIIEWLDEELGNREFIAGERYTIADITAMIAADFMKPARIDMPEHCANFARWYETVRTRDSASA